MYIHNVFHYAKNLILQISTREVFRFTWNVQAHALICRQTLPNLVVGVQTISLNQYALHHVDNVRDQFQSCIVGL